MAPSQRSAAFLLATLLAYCKFHLTSAVGSASSKRRCQSPTEMLANAAKVLHCTPEGWTGRFIRANPIQVELFENMQVDELTAWPRFEGVLSCLFRARSQKIVPLETAALSVSFKHYHALPLLREQTSHLDTGGGEGRAALAVDWRFARAAASQLSGAAAGAAAGVAGKAAAGATAKAAGGAVASSSLAGKLAAPFVTKAATAAGAAAAGAASGAAAGPVGVAVGAGVGIGVDFALAKGVELARRRDFEADTAAALGTAHAEWRELMGAELARYIDVLVDDAVQLTANAQTSPRE
ncbi:hypothetical protein EMIHUDRAFT_460383 [Emiliania huxleyi CCMP1516]|uniref:Uncharacterized protein n=2 Tax=Emiliania huxleyi TaxID=2903 RepID=A0A0D3I7M7_EMIH1|nr:hypothetical protein EMIHUDRAFT_448542 [Emiliania huxleyi CCMP1516]XP_005792349.1 hypothetical protein EMIHUDRAFT_460383 [Emiliania huxleyi CCMP1516]EOD07262.1 hypothetical protein EMIHUDRAFT_448542 [Emiliania huxleyi CCMP1516]EOD39920.1 hypothetical protein EMIHUDRAFT_460383 [Emiliania huxleyi CCMP1516]|eukprot:XP_005759691.1 hypothetical protein EMIHUDRAFT_448542 [Emiliania huxleyi CCMP1516]